MQRPMQYCAQPGCSQLVTRGRCATHAVRTNAITRRWYYTVRWTRLRHHVLHEAAYTCAHCGHVQYDLDIDHIRPHHGDHTLFWDRRNLQALCPSCHTRKSRQEMG
jgi:5-methylcytosine-specific restriction endonuclease McrA